MTDQIETCRCGNDYLAIRTDIYKDKREFVYCDVCGALADRKTWQAGMKKPLTPLTDNELIELKKVTRAANPAQQWGDTLAYGHAVMRHCGASGKLYFEGQK